MKCHYRLNDWAVRVLPLFGDPLLYEPKHLAGMVFEVAKELYKAAQDENPHSCLGCWMYHLLPEFESPEGYYETDDIQGPEPWARTVKVRAEALALQAAIHNVPVVEKAFEN